MSADPKVTPLRPKRICPECGRPSDRASYPFCSPRCKAVDLNRWLSGTYVIPGPVSEEALPGEDDDGR
ncbi:DNA gyrase inhibitor YacG [Aureimonas endophytica]|uniref:DNA gyrase inhibitor YacG n=1 Tax=Aureimonas endophytica TaxID=2027858 RepID=A0A916ZGG3_9HYPH|nr:DNA gyrase inhibitor YacG [Aureimonas endophytica]GGD96144.1 DNA gyrase inhibitor YacG [Aureimonas endophytica]